MPPYLRPGLAKPAPSRDGLDTAFWEGLRNEKLLLQDRKSTRLNSSH